MHKKLSFHSNPFEIDFIIMTGACRSGKTTIAKTLAASDAIEFLDEPWIPMMLPALAHYGLFEPELFKSLLRSYLDELAKDIILYRRANFRPLDKSSLWQFKSPEKVYARMLKVQTREDVQKHITQNNTKILLVLPETTPFISLFLQSIPKCKIIHVVRNKEAVADEIAKKRWFSNEQLLAPQNNQPYQKYKSNLLYYLPWWLEEKDFEWFLQATEFERGIFYWNFFVTESRNNAGKLDLENLNQYLEISFEEYLRDPKKVVLNTSEFMGIK